MRPLQTVTSHEGNHVVQRIKPAMPIQAVQTFEVVSPLETHYKVVSCKEIECVRERDGWRTVLDVSTVNGQQQARWITHYSGRRFTYEQTGAIITFTFSPGQSCFNKHQKPLGRPELYVVRDGDWRGNPTGNQRIHTKPEHWVEHSEEELARLRRIQERG